MSDTYRGGNTEKKPRDTAITITSILFFVTGCFGVISLAFLPYVLLSHAFPVLPLIGEIWHGDPFDVFGFDGILVLVLIFIGVSALETVTGFWLRDSKKSGGRLGIILLAVGLVLSVGFAMPIWEVANPIKLALLVWKWNTLS